MTIDEAIAHAREVATEQKRRSGECVINDNECDKFSVCIKCAKEHEQLAEWLEELKAYKQNTDICPICDTYCSYLAEEFENGYNKAIDDCKELTFREVVYYDSLNDRTEFRELAEQLKGGVKE